MNKEYHILNGDSLKEQLPNSINGENIVARLCLVDGNVKAKTLEELFEVRAEFLSNNYADITKEDYYKKSVSEIKKIEKIPNESIINLWFEDDLFCQVNFWFLINLISKKETKHKIHLVRPKQNCAFSFGSMHPDELIASYNSRFSITDIELKELSRLWVLYQHDNIEKMLQIAEKLKVKYSFLIPVIKAHKERLPKNGKLGRPTNIIKQIIKDLNTTKFGPVFQEFCKKEAIYGFGDLQVKRIFDRVVRQH